MRSNPFTAGHWSLRGLRQTNIFRAKCFKPLHGGALVTTVFAEGERDRTLPVSNPFTAGHWSLLAREVKRGMPVGFKPLHGGALVTTNRIHGQDSTPMKFQTPSRRGIGHYPKLPAPGPVDGEVSNPFTAGHWSLLQWLRVRSAFPARFKPLHGGALVTTTTRETWRDANRHVSNPFTAGHWSLQVFSPPAMNEAQEFQTPSRRGIGHYAEGNIMYAFEDLGFKPLHGGALVTTQRLCIGGFSPHGGFKPLHGGALVTTSRLWP